MTEELKNRVKKITRNILAAKGKHVPKEPTWWTCFYYDGFTPDDLHCTHKFLGVLEDTAVEEVKKILDQYFNSKPFTPFKVSFCREDFFGPDKDVRVLTPIEYNPENFLLDLRSRLDNYKEDNYPDYRPHVTTEKPIIDKPFYGYALMYDDKIIKSYVA